jgi:chromosome segregation ATPase
MSDAPAAPVALLDPALLAKKNEELSSRINGLEGDKQELKRSIDILRGNLAAEKSAAASARGQVKPMKEQIDTLRAQLASSEDLKELVRLRAEVAKAHTAAAVWEKAAKEREAHVKAQLQDLTARAGRAEGKFQALESTAAIMAKARDKANEAAAAMLAERDLAQKRGGELEGDLAAMKAELMRVRADLDKAQAEAKALRQAPAPKVK